MPTDKGNRDLALLQRDVQDLENDVKSMTVKLDRLIEVLSASQQDSMRASHSIELRVTEHETVIEGLNKEVDGLRAKSERWDFANTILSLVAGAIGLFKPQP